MACKRTPLDAWLRAPYNAARKLKHISFVTPASSLKSGHDDLVKTIFAVTA